jgi:hypothetical protein
MFEQRSTQSAAKHGETREYTPGGQALPGDRQRARPVRRRLSVVLHILLVALVLSAGGVIGWLGVSHRLPFLSAQGSQQQGPAATGPIVGHLYFASSGQASPQSAVGIADEVQLDLATIPPPAAGKSYYAWLITGSVEGQPILLGRLDLTQGGAHLLYAGDEQHTNLLALVNRFLITEEPTATPPPNVPDPDRSTWKFAAAFSQVPNRRETPSYSLLDHLRHLLSGDPTLDQIGLYGGLDIWLFRDAQKILEWAGSARDAWGTDPGLIHRQLVRIVEYLDGWRYALQRELAAGTPLLVDSRIALDALLELNVPNQQPPGLLDHIGLHLTGVAESPAASADQQRLAGSIDAALTNVRGWLERVHSDALQLVALQARQLALASTKVVLDDLATQAQYAFSGQENPTTNTLADGVTQIHYAMPQLAAMTIVPVQCTAANSAAQQSVELCL